MPARSDDPARRDGRGGRDGDRVRAWLGGAPLSDDCLFCRLVRGEIPAEVVRRDERFVAFQDIAPKAPVHVLVVPVEHVASIAGVDGLDDATRAAMLTFIADVAEDLDLGGSGYRVTTNHGPDSHQSVDHLHWHVMGGGTLSLGM